MPTQLGPDPIYRGARPLISQDWAALQRVGIKTVISLEYGYFEFFRHEVNSEADKCAARSISFAHLQLGDLVPPSKKDLLSFVRMVKNSLANGPVYFHCRWGNDRTGLGAALIRVLLQNWPVDKAIQEMYDLGFHKFPYELLGWVSRLKEVLNEQKGSE